MHPSRRPSDEPAVHTPDLAPPSPLEPEPELLALQRAAGNAAVARLLARQPAAVAPPDLFKLPAGVLDDWRAAGDRVQAWFDEIAEPHRESLTVPGSVAELVHQACELEIELEDGGVAKVRDKMKPAEVEQRLRERARAKGMRLTEHRDASDLPGMKSELDAILANLGAIPTSITLGNDQIKVVGSISGKIGAEAKAGPVKIAGEGSSEGIEGSVTVGPVKGSFGQKSVKAEVKIGDLVTVTGGLEPKGGGDVAWKADIAIGTIGKLIMPEDVAKVFKGAEETFSIRAGELARNLGDPGKVKEHGGALAGAVKDVVEKAQKSAAQAKKPGWRIGAEIKGDPAGGVSGSVTLTWVF